MNQEHGGSHSSKDLLVEEYLYGFDTHQMECDDEFLPWIVKAMKTNTCLEKMNNL